MAKIDTSKITNKELFDVIGGLKKASTKTGVSVFRAVAEKLSAPASQRPQVNLLKIDRNTKEGEKIIVPGKVLGTGSLTKKITIIGFSASESAIKKIEAAGSKFVPLKDFLSKPDTKVKIIG
jgi:large subunit ribosomal protein L18e